MQVTWRKVKGKYVIKSNGTYQAFTPSELEDLKKVLEDIESGNNVFNQEDNR